MESGERKELRLSPAAIVAQQHDREHMPHHDARVKQPEFGALEKDDEGCAECRDGREQSSLDQQSLIARYGTVGKNETHRREYFESGEVSLTETQNNRAERTPQQADEAQRDQPPS